MKPVKVELSKEFKELNVIVFSDEHIGDPRCDWDYLNERIDRVKNTKNLYCILNGDLMDNATKTSIGDTYSQTLGPQEQIDKLIDLFKPIKNKILCITQGNHEARTYKKEGIDVMKNMARSLGLESRYSPESVLLFLRFGQNNRHRKQRYTFYVAHGSGGGRKEGAKAIRLADLACIVDADIYVVGHTHLPMVMKEDYFRVCEGNSSIKKITKLFVNSSANLDYGGYGEVIGCKPASKDKPIIYLDGVKFKTTATL